MAVRVSAAVSYLRLLAALVVRAPNPGEAFVRARLLLVALVKIVAVEACVITGSGGRPAASTSSSLSLKLTLSPDGGSVDEAAAAAARTVGVGAGVEARSAASDTVVLCMQTLKFILDWAEQPAVGGGGGGGGSSGNGGRAVLRPVGSTPTATAAASASATAGAPAAARGAGAGVGTGLGPAATRSAGGAAGWPEAGGESCGQAPTCLHGLRTRPSNGGEGGGADGGSAGLRFVCPLVDTARRCEFVQNVQLVRHRPTRR